MSLHEAMTRGDLIEVTPKAADLGTTRDFGVLRGTTLTTMERIGNAVFVLQLDAGGTQRELVLNCNFVEVKVLFAASVARTSE